jgi:two-component system chemotaxis response regulator CheB
MPKIVVMGGSTGSIDALKVILSGLPEGFPAAVLIVSHVGSRESFLPDLLESCSALPVCHASQGAPLVAGEVMVAPSDLHLLVADDEGRPYAKLLRGPKENHCRPAIDPLFRSAAMVYGADAIAVLLSGFLDDGTVGIQAIKAYGGIAVVQDPVDAEAPEMPASALSNASVDFVMNVNQIALKLVELAGSPATLSNTGTEAPPAPPDAQERVVLEVRMMEHDTGMEELERIGRLVPLTCPECSGPLWELRDGAPARYRCHTGHAFTAKVLESLQKHSVEDALWAAVRALHEQERLFRNLHEKADGRGLNEAGFEYLAKAEQAREQSQLLRHLITARIEEFSEAAQEG